MSRSALWTVAAVAATVLVVGCKGSDDDLEPAIVPKKVAFEGKLEPKFVGDWQSSDGNSKAGIRKDGSLTIETTSRSVNGKSVVNVSGQWLATDDTLLFRYETKARQPIVLKYSASFSGDVLTLAQSGGRIKTVYRRH